MQHSPTTDENARGRREICIAINLQNKRGFTTNAVAILADCRTHSDVSGHHWSSRWSDQRLFSKAQQAPGPGVRIVQYPGDGFHSDEGEQAGGKNMPELVL